MAGKKQELNLYKIMQTKKKSWFPVYRWREVLCLKVDYVHPKRLLKYWTVNVFMILGIKI